MIIGLGVSGLSAARFLLKQGICVSAVDQKADQIKEDNEVKSVLQSGVKLHSDKEPLDLSLYDLAVASPGVPPTHALYKASLEAGLEVTGEIELACRHLKKNCLGITGSNGKTTTVLLTEHVLEASGKKAIAVGNIGKPLTGILIEEEPKDLLVIELSSWQLETMQTRILDAAVILNITPNHLDRHLTMEAYAKAKFQIGRCLKEGKKLFINYDTFVQFKDLAPAENSVTFGYHPLSDVYCDKQHIFIDKKPVLALPHPHTHKQTHDVENLMAAFLLCHEAGISSESFLKAYASFTKPPHRIEFIRKFKEVSFYDDSKATSIDAVLKAIQSMEGKVILIAGGVHKGSSYTPWIDGFDQKVHCVCAIGEAAEQMKNELASHMEVKICLNLEDALHYAVEKANSGDNILLSPGCASFDMFKDYKQRGELFKQLVKELK